MTRISADSSPDFPALWQEREHFTVLAARFGDGHGFLQTWQRWQQDPRRPGRLTYVALENRPLARAQLRGAHLDRAETASLAQALVAAWPPLTPNIHLLEFDEGRVRLLLALGEFEPTLRRLMVQADAVWLHEPLPADDPWAPSRRLAAALARLTRVGAPLLALPADAAFGEHLRAEGFVLAGATASGPDEQGSIHAEYRPRFQSRRMPTRSAANPGRGNQPSRQALVIGGGLAGTLSAQALARTGWICTVVDRNPQPALEASGNPAGLFHGSAHMADGLHARFSRAAALLAARRYGSLIDAGAVPGAVSGVLRLGVAEAPGCLLDREYLQTLSAEQARNIAGCAITGPAWLYPNGGWMSPGDLCRSALKTPGVHWLGDTTIAGLESADGVWRALTADGRCIAEAPVVICATGSAPIPLPGGDQIPLERVRGQISWLHERDLVDPSPGPRLPLSGNGYALRLPSGKLLFGASSQAGDLGPELRAADHAFNLNRLTRLCGIAASADATPRGRVGWRATMPDRLPLVGAWPVPVDQLPPELRVDQCRWVPRIAGLYVLLGLASRGLTWAPLAAEVLAAWINGTAMPLETDLLDAIDPARVLVRHTRKARLS